ncbi:hypothetical protein A3G63_02960 [Candidatus Kaiserbacteria bacterium RIFCSPLOWO2_12_FULL_52_8]|uniref:Uncharacterized protein n=1 Tax=Candidatus Kaiserbacteria bacterium RIFCSPHIGHO2_01_FULL_53_31 TaxID=1798481 RepID=A0A1F6CIN8_9BACT|nr:MAG: hypothetical protein A2678_01275 [Candidatus Kaiserbacteria bacterium RIFCSPHIGHO2_01_FULL_53_31]OGG94555.1 MAG: hypothetical protein A3G63_02960 [Candidatus Kaiserbacteria bacterium RIFCSPLOWO2_12_FULL_52_8]
MRGIVTILTFVSVVLFPWPLSAFVALIAGVSEPLVPLAAGLFADTLYYMPQSGAWPLFTLSGAVVTIIAAIVHDRLRTSRIGG